MWPSQCTITRHPFGLPRVLREQGSTDCPPVNCQHAPGEHQLCKSFQRPSLHVIRPMPVRKHDPSHQNPTLQQGQRNTRSNPADLRWYSNPIKWKPTSPGPAHSTCTFCLFPDPGIGQKQTEGSTAFSREGRLGASTGSMSAPSAVTA